MQQVSEVTVQGWDPKKKEKIVAHARSGDEQSRMGAEKSDTSRAPAAFGQQGKIFPDEPVFTQAQADDLARSRFGKTAGVVADHSKALPGTNRLETRPRVSSK